MPGGDRTGPWGAGPRTGRAAGYCSGAGTPGYANPGPGRGFGMGFGSGRGWARGGGWGFGGGGRGWRHWFRATGQPGWMRFGGYAPFNAPGSAADAGEEKQILMAEAQALEAELDRIKRRLSEVETKP